MKSAIQCDQLIKDKFIRYNRYTHTHTHFEETNLLGRTKREDKSWVNFPPEVSKSQIMNINVMTYTNPNSCPLGRKIYAKAQRLEAKYIQRIVPDNS